MVTILQLLEAILLGIVQGVSEWLPISSKTQVLTFSNYVLHLTYQQAYSFGLFMEIGTILAAVIYFRKEIRILLNTLMGRGDAMDKKLFKFVVISTFFTGIVAVPLYLFADSLSQAYIGLPMIILGLILFMDAILIKYARSKYATDAKRRDLSQMKLKDYVLVGIAQGIAALPGVSRSGITTSTMLLLNVEANEAFRLSFLDMIFATTAAVFVTLIFSKTNISAAVATITIPGLIISIIVSTIISLFLIDFLLKMAKKSSIVYFIVALGIIALCGGIFFTLYPPQYTGPIS